MSNPFDAMSLQDATTWWQADAARLALDHGIVVPEARAYLHPAIRRNFDLAMDAQPSLITVSSAGIPAFLTNYVDPALIEVLLTPNKAAVILGEGKKGDWTTATAMFPIVEHTGEVSTYGDWNNNGSTGANINFPQRQSYHYQTMTQWGELQLARAGLAQIDYSARLNTASAIVLNKFQNNSYFFGIAGLQNYGLLNDPGLSASLTPSTKAAGGVKWIVNGVLNATPNEIYADIQALFIQLTNQTLGLVEADAKICVAMHPTTAVALTATNSFNVSVTDLLKKNFPNIRFETATQYSTTAGFLVQMIADDIEGAPVGTCAYTEKMRAHAIVRHTSAFEQKKSQGTWGTILFRPIGVAQMLGV